MYITRVAQKIMPHVSFFWVSNKARNKNMAEMLLQHDNARPHTSLKTQEAITKFCWAVLPHPPYSPDLAPSDFCLFGDLKMLSAV
jgi:histone-lysine N-methyltransferase SETMAR